MAAELADLQPPTSVDDDDFGELPVSKTGGALGDELPAAPSSYAEAWQDFIAATQEARQYTHRVIELAASSMVAGRFSPITAEGSEAGTEADEPPTAARVAEQESHSRRAAAILAVHKRQESTRGGATDSKEEQAPSQPVRSPVKQTQTQPQSRRPATPDAAGMRERLEAERQRVLAETDDLRSVRPSTAASSVAGSAASSVLSTTPTKAQGPVSGSAGSPSKAAALRSPVPAARTPTQQSQQRFVADTGFRDTSGGSAQRSPVKPVVLSPPRPLSPLRLPDLPPQAPLILQLAHEVASVRAAAAAEAAPAAEAERERMRAEREIALEAAREEERQLEAFRRALEAEAAESRRRREEAADEARRAAEVRAHQRAALRLQAQVRGYMLRKQVNLTALVAAARAEAAQCAAEEAARTAAEQETRRQAEERERQAAEEAARRAELERIAALQRAKEEEIARRAAEEKARREAEEEFQRALAAELAEARRREEARRQAEAAARALAAERASMAAEAERSQRLNARWRAAEAARQARQAELQFMSAEDAICRKLNVVWRQRDEEEARRKQQEAEAAAAQAAAEAEAARALRPPQSPISLTRSKHGGKPTAVTVCTKVQALWRGWRVRTDPSCNPLLAARLARYAAMQDSATRIQALWRGGRLRSAMASALAAAKFDDADTFDYAAVDVASFLPTLNPSLLEPSTTSSKKQQQQQQPPLLQAHPHPPMMAYPPGMPPPPMAAWGAPPGSAGGYGYGYGMSLHPQQQHQQQMMMQMQMMHMHPQQQQQHAAMVWAAQQQMLAQQQAAAAAPGPRIDSAGTGSVASLPPVRTPQPSSRGDPMDRPGSADSAGWELMSVASTTDNAGRSNQAARAPAPAPSYAPPRPSPSPVVRPAAASSPALPSKAVAAVEAEWGLTDPRIAALILRRKARNTGSVSNTTTSNTSATTGSSGPTTHIVGGGHPRTGNTVQDNLPDHLRGSSGAYRGGDSAYSAGLSTLKPPSSPVRVAAAVTSTLAAAAPAAVRGAASFATYRAKPDVPTAPVAPLTAVSTNHAAFPPGHGSSKQQMRMMRMALDGVLPMMMHKPQGQSSGAGANGSFSASGNGTGSSRSQLPPIR